MMKIWERYFLSETIKSFLLFIVGFYGVFTVVDFACNAARFHAHQVKFSVGKILSYYAFQFVDISEVLVPFALMLATIKTLCQLNMRNELVAMLASGVKLKTLLRPFVMLGLTFTVLMYLNTEWLVPKATQSMTRIDNSRSGLRSKANAKSPVRHLVLEDKSTVLFQSYDANQQVFFDAYWIKSINEVYRMKYLSPYTPVPTGQYVDYLVRNKSGDLVEQGYYAVKTFPELKFNKKTLFETITPPEEQSYTGLWSQLSLSSDIQSEKQAESLTIFYRKLAMPWLCLLAVIAPIPFCVRFSRNMQTFMIYAASIFGLVALFLVMDAGLVLGKRQVIAPFWAALTPLLLVSGFFGTRYALLK